MPDIKHIFEPLCACAEVSRRERPLRHGRCVLFVIVAVLSDLLCCFTEDTAELVRAHSLDNEASKIAWIELKCDRCEVG